MPVKGTPQTGFPKKGNLYKKLKIGVLVDSYDIPNWAYQILDRIEHSDYAELVLIIKNGTSGKTSINLSPKITKNPPSFLFNLFNRLEQKVCSLNPNPFETKDIHQLFPSVSCLTMNPVKETFSDSFTAEDIGEIKLMNLDVFIKFGFRVLSGEILKSTKYGVWSHHIGDGQGHREEPDGFWEVLEESPLTCCLLYVLAEERDPQKVLYRSYSQTDKVFVRRNRGACYWKMSSFLPRTLEKLYKDGEEEFISKLEKVNEPPVIYSKGSIAVLSGPKFVGLVLRHYIKYFINKIRDIFYFDQWSLMYQFNQKNEFSSEVFRFHKIIPPKDRYWADPFIIFEAGQYFVFFEEYLIRSKKGHISYLTLDRNGNITSPVTVINHSYHISYPFVFLHQNEYFMIPESAQNRTIDLYKCIEFPSRWEFVKTLMRDVYAVDTTILQRDGTWWLFTNIRENDGGSSLDELFLFSASDIFSEHWMPHPNNPIISDVKLARPAGRVFFHNGQIFRPSQDNSRRYGYGININQIMKISESEYQETRVNHIGPDWDKKIVGAHTINWVEGLTMIDGLIRRAR
jgi:hypothetical protein